MPCCSRCAGAAGLQPKPPGAAGSSSGCSHGAGAFLVMGLCWPLCCCCCQLEHAAGAPLPPVSIAQAAERELAAPAGRLASYNTRELSSLLFAYGRLLR